ncbi:galanin receptor type 1-like [Montipora foliosa]|uniref:galanin receptor type 1-like n=1 Tax=Montipora foliosa TaxID=591990 RepID=UPI0035F1A42E
MMQDLANLSSMDLETEQRRFTDKRKMYHNILFNINCVFLAVGTMENILVCVVMGRVYKVRTPHYTSKLSSFFILQLAITDLIYRAVNFFHQVSAKHHIELSIEQCKITIYSTFTCASVTFLLLAAIAIDRYVHILHPIRSLSLKLRTGVVMLLIWIYAMLVCFGFIFSAKVSDKFFPHRLNSTTNNASYCRVREPPRHCTPGTSRALDRRISFTSYFLFAFIVPLLCTILSYSRITVSLWRKTKANGLVNRYTARVKLRAIKLFGIVVLSFILSWGPITTLDLVASYTLKARKIDRVGNFPLRPLFHCITLTSSIFNPMIYAFGDANFRRSLRLLLRIRQRNSVNTTRVYPARQKTVCIQMTGLNQRVSPGIQACRQSIVKS